MNKENIDRYIEIFREKKAYYESYCIKLKDLLLSFLDNANIPYHIIETRVKSEKSLREKLLRDGKDYKNLTTEITDLAGLRIILYYQKDVQKVTGLIREQFSIDEENSIDKGKLLKENEFGYLSVHLIVLLNKDRSILPEWKAVKDLYAEIQIRTVLQHSWASISHILQYKREIDIPTQFRRKLNRLAGLLELADEEFESLKDDQSKLELKISKSIKSKDYNLPIDYLTVEDYLNKNSFLPEIEKYIKNKKNIELEYTRKDGEGKISQIILILNYFEIDTIYQFDKILNENRDKLYFLFDVLMPETKGQLWGGTTETFFIIFLIAILSKSDKEIEEIYIKLGWISSFLMDELIKYRNTAANIDIANSGA